MKVKFDKETQRWFEKNPAQQTTVRMCEKCGLFFKPSLGHKCKMEGVAKIATTTEEVEE